MNVDLSIMENGEIKPLPTPDILQTVQGAAFQWHDHGSCSGFATGHYHLVLVLGPTPVMCPVCFATVMNLDGHTEVMHKAPEEPPQ